MGILNIQLSRLQPRLADRDLGLVVTQRAKEWLAARGYDPTFGARPLKRVIQREIGDRLALMVLEGKVTDGATVTVDIDSDGAVTLTV